MEQKLQERKTRYIPEEDKRRGAELGMYVCISVMQYGVGDVGRWTQREHVCTLTGVWGVDVFCLICRI